ncbi:sec-independent protein translocase protein TATB, chloroplastic-like [Amaranthus tricolor]|uniref:sec-independent protein translocase protein TATB, chloroplastic-like n=1 Tax=Amaranthus tricolor TaxID=29722 RepID=UPI002586A2B7|nr:sec-independent protein translocase protein TATB, chloroplastic-like [Amaranthus tricolor]
MMVIDRVLILYLIVGDCRVFCDSADWVHLYSTTPKRTLKRLFDKENSMSLEWSETYGYLNLSKTSKNWYFFLNWVFFSIVHYASRRTKYRGKVVYASLFGVGAPEALVIGVVALLVFGPKGLAEVARNLGKTLRAFQPTIKELQEVSREFKSTLEREISLDDDPIQARNTFERKMENYTSNLSVSTPDESQTVPITDPNVATSNNAYSTEDYLKITEEQLKAQQEAMSPPSVTQLQHETPPEALQQDDLSSPPESQIEPQIQAQAMKQDVSSPPENSTVPESQPQDAQKTTTAATVVQRPKSES